MSGRPSGGGTAGGESPPPFDGRRMERSRTALRLSCRIWHRGWFSQGWERRSGDMVGNSVEDLSIYLSIYLSNRFLQFHTTRRRGRSFLAPTPAPLAVRKPPQLSTIGEIVDVGQMSYSSLPAYTMWPVRLANLDGCGNVVESDPKGRANTVMFFSRHCSGWGSERSTIFR